MKTFTIVIPTYNNLDLFKSAYSSVCKQDFKDYEIVVVDDSTDSSIEDYVSSLNNPVLVYRHHVPSAGAVNNWNHGLQLASGKYVIVLHHDEAFEEDNYLTSLNVQFQKGYEVLVTRVKVFNGGILKPNVFSQALMKFFIGCPSLLFLCNVIGPCSCIAFKREHITDFDNRLNWLVDVDWYYRLLKRKSRKFLDHLHINSFNDHEDKITNQIDVKQSEVKDIAILNIKYKYHLLLRGCLFINKMVMLYNLKGIIKKLIRK